jgi:hypothetical protein
VNDAFTIRKKERSMSEMQWATVDLMGHAQTAGRIEMAGGLLRVDVPEGENYRTEYYGMTAIYSIKIVSEEIARAYAHRTIDVMAYDAPIVTREQHLAAMRQFEQREERLQYRVQELERRLTMVNALPEPSDKTPTRTVYKRDDGVFMEKDVYLACPDLRNKCDVYEIPVDAPFPTDE